MASDKNTQVQKKFKRQVRKRDPSKLGHDMRSRGGDRNTNLAAALRDVLQ